MSFPEEVQSLAQYHRSASWWAHFLNESLFCQIFPTEYICVLDYRWYVNTSVSNQNQLFNHLFPPCMTFVSHVPCSWHSPFPIFSFAIIAYHDHKFDSTETTPRQRPQPRPPSQPRSRLQRQRQRQRQLRWRPQLIEQRVEFRVEDRTEYRTEFRGKGYRTYEDSNME